MSTIFMSDAVAGAIAGGLLVLVTSILSPFLNHIGKILSANHEKNAKRKVAVGSQLRELNKRLDYVIDVITSFVYKTDGLDPKQVVYYKSEIQTPLGQLEYYVTPSIDDYKKFLLNGTYIIPDYILNDLNAIVSKAKAIEKFLIDAILGAKKTINYTGVNELIKDLQVTNDLCIQKSKKYVK